MTESTYARGDQNVTCFFFQRDYGSNNVAVYENVICICLGGMGYGEN